MKSSFKQLIQNLIISGLVCAMLFALTGGNGGMNGILSAFAAVMSSTNYSLQSDSVNFGGAQGNSSIYRVEDTLGEVATGNSGSTSYNIKAGYQQMNVNFISMTAQADLTMSPSLGGITGGTSDGTASTTVVTDSAAGYELYIKASTSPAMQGNATTDSIADYVRDGAAPDYNFSVAAGNAEFGFSPEGTDVTNEYKDDGISACSTGSNETVDKCWSGLTTSNELVSRRTSNNTPAGTKTTFKFRLTIGSSAFKLEDTYVATTTMTAVSL